MINRINVKITFWIATLFLFMVIVILFYILILNGNINIPPHVFGAQFDLACIGMTLSIAVAFTFLYLVRGKLDIFEFPVWFTLNVYFQVVLNVWLLQRDVIFVRDQYFLSPWLVAEPNLWANRAILLIWGGLIVLWITYFGAIRFQRGQNRIPTRVRSKPRLKLMIAIWAITWLINFYATVSGAQGYLNTNTSFSGGNYLALVSLINIMVTFNLMIYFIKKPTRLGTIWIIFTLATGLFVGLIIGSKSAIFILLYLIMSYYYARKHLPKIWIAVGLVSLVIVIPVVTIFRANLFASGYSRESGASFTDRIPVLINSIEEAVRQPFTEITNQSRTTFELRQGSVFEVTAAFLAVHPQIRPFLFKDLVDTIASSIIPRFLWPGKPTAHPTLYNISSQYLGAADDSSFASSGQFGDSYRMGGVIFTILWIVFLTLLAYKAYSMGPGRGSIAGTGFYLVILIGLITYDGDVFPTIMHLLQFVIILFLLNRYVLFQRFTENNAVKPDTDARDSRSKPSGFLTN